MEAGYGWQEPLRGRADVGPIIYAGWQSIVHIRLRVKTDIGAIRIRNKIPQSVTNNYRNRPFHSDVCLGAVFQK